MNKIDFFKLLIATDEHQYCTIQSDYSIFII